MSNPFYHKLYFLSVDSRPVAKSSTEAFGSQSSGFVSLPCVIYLTLGGAPLPSIPGIFISAGAIGLLILPLLSQTITYSVPS